MEGVAVVPDAGVSGLNRACKFAVAAVVPSACPLHVVFALAVVALRPRPQLAAHVGRCRLRSSRTGISAVPRCFVVDRLNPRTRPGPRSVR